MAMTFVCPGNQDMVVKESLSVVCIPGLKYSTGSESHFCSSYETLIGLEGETFEEMSFVV